MIPGHDHQVDALHGYHSLNYDIIHAHAGSEKYPSEKQTHSRYYTINAYSYTN